MNTIHDAQNASDPTSWGELVERDNSFEIRRDEMSNYAVHSGNDIIFATSLDDAREAAREIPKNLPPAQVCPQAPAELETQMPEMLESFISSDGTRIVRLYYGLCRETHGHEFKLDVHTRGKLEYINYLPDEERDIAYWCFTVFTSENAKSHT